MNSSPNQDRVVHLPEQSRYVVHFHDGDQGELVYRQSGNTLALIHSEVPASRRGAGLGGRLMDCALTQIEQDGFKVQPVCRYTQVYIARNAQWHKLLA